MKDEALKQLALAYFEEFTRQWVATREMIPHFAFLTGKGEPAILMADPDLMDNPVYKNSLANTVRSKIKEVDAQAVFFISDTWYASVSVDQEGAEEGIEKGWSLMEMERRGFCTKRQEVMFLVESKAEPDDALMVRQDYEIKHGDVVLGKRETLPQYVMGIGRFSGYFLEGGLDPYDHKMSMRQMSEMMKKRGSRIDEMMKKRGSPE